MTLPDDDDELFDLLVEWLYTQNYNMPQPTGDKDKDAGRFREPIRLYVLADKYGITSLKNMIAKMVFHAMQEYNTVWPDMNTIAYTYQNVPSTSGMRKLLADFHACKPNPDWYNITKVRILLQSNPEFAADVMLSLFRSTSGASMRMKAYLEDE